MVVKLLALRSEPNSVGTGGRPTRDLNPRVRGERRPGLPQRPAISYLSLYVRIRTRSGRRSAVGHYGGQDRDGQRRTFASILASPSGTHPSI